MSTRTPPVDLSEELLSEFGANASYVAELFHRYRANPVGRRRRVAALLPGALRRARGARGRRGVRAGGAPGPRGAVRSARGSGARGRASAAPGRARAHRREHGGEPRRADGDDAAADSDQAPRREPAPHQRVPRASTEQSKISFTHLISWAIVQALKAFPVHERRLRRVGRRAGPRPARGDPVRPRRRRAEVGRHALAPRPQRQGRREARLRAVRGGLRRPHRPRPHGQAADPRLRGHDDLADEPRHARNDGLRAAADAGPGRDHRHRRDRVPGGVRARWPRRRSRAWRSARS